MKYAVLLAVTVQGIDTWTIATVPETYKANVIEITDKGGFSALEEVADGKITFTVTQMKNRYAAIGFTPAVKLDDGKLTMKGIDFALIKSQNNNDNFDLYDYNGKNDQKPDGEEQGGERDTVKEVSKSNAEVDGKRWKSFEFTRSLVGDANGDATLECKDKAEYMEYPWFVRNYNDQNWEPFDASGTYWMRLQNEDGKCMVSLASEKPPPEVEESAFKAMASLSVLTAAFVVSTL